MRWLLGFHRFGGEFEDLVRFDHFRVGEVLFDQLLGSWTAVIDNADEDECRNQQYTDHGRGAESA